MNIVSNFSFLDTAKKHTLWQGILLLSVICDISDKHSFELGEAVNCLSSSLNLHNLCFTHYRAKPDNFIQLFFLIKIIVFIFLLYFPSRNSALWLLEFLLHRTCSCQNMDITHLSFYLLFLCLSCSSSPKYLLPSSTYPPLSPTELLLKAAFISIPFGFPWREKEKCVRRDISFSFLLSPGKNFYKSFNCFHTEIKGNNYNIPEAQRRDFSKLHSDPFHILPVILLLSTSSAPLPETRPNAANDKIQWENDKNKVFGLLLYVF